MTETSDAARRDTGSAEKWRFSTFARHTLLVLALAALVFLLWQITSVILLAFLGVLLAVFLSQLADMLSAHTPLTRPVALFVVGFLLVGLIGLGVWLIQSQVAQQLSQLPQQIRQAVDQLRQYTWGQRLIAQAPSLSQLLGDSAGVFSQITGAASRLFDLLASVLIVVFLGFYLASDPRLYERGLIQLLPEGQRPRAREALGITGRALWLWLLTQFASMTVIGVLSWIGLTILGVRMALVLALIAGLLEFIPIVGPFLAAVPAVLVAFMQGPTQALYVLLLYIGIQQLESYLVTPIIQRYGTTLPPALTLLAAVIFGLLFGPLGIVVATPLMLTLYVLTKLLYVEDVLGDTTTVPGRPAAQSS